MGRLFSYDAYKIRKAKYWWICLLVGVALTFMQLIATKMLTETLGSMSQNGVKIEAMAKTFTLTDAVPKLMTSINILIAIVVSLFVGSDFANGTIKNVASKGLGRGHIITAKFIWSALLSVAGLVIMAGTGFGLCLVMLDHGQMNAEFWQLTARAFGLAALQSVAYSSIFAFGATLLASGGTAIAFNIALTIIVPPLALLLQVAVIKSDNFNVFNLLPAGLEKLNLANNASKELWIYVGAMLAYIIISYIASVMILKKRDIK